MVHPPQPVAEFLNAKRIAVAGVSRDRSQPANLIFRRLRETGHEVVAINPKTTDVEGQRCYPSLAAVPDPIDAVMIVTPPGASADVVHQAADRGVRTVWFHRSFGDGSVSPEALVACSTHGIEPIVGGCPMMYCGNVDVGHKCFRWWLGFRGKLPV